MVGLWTASDGPGSERFKRAREDRAGLRWRAAAALRARLAGAGEDSRGTKRARGGVQGAGGGSSGTHRGTPRETGIRPHTLRAGQAQSCPRVWGGSISDRLSGPWGAPLSASFPTRARSAQTNEAVAVCHAECCCRRRLFIGHLCPAATEKTMPTAKVAERAVQDVRCPSVQVEGLQRVAGRADQRDVLAVLFRPLSRT